MDFSGTCKPPKASSKATPTDRASKPYLDLLGISPQAPNVGFSPKKLKVNSGMSKVETAERSSNKLKSTEITLEVGN